MPFCWKVAPCVVAGEGEGNQVKVYSREGRGIRAEPRIDLSRGAGVKTSREGVCHPERSEGLFPRVFSAGEYPLPRPQNDAPGSLQQGRKVPKKWKRCSVICRP